MSMSLTPISKVFSGDPRGFISGPLLFVALINDLPSLFRVFETSPVADDTKFFLRKQNGKRFRLANHEIERLSPWMNINGQLLIFQKLPVVNFKTAKKFALQYPWTKYFDTWIHLKSRKTFWWDGAFRKPCFSWRETKGETPFQISQTSSICIRNAV